MYFYLTGIDYNSAPIEAREQLYRRAKDISIDGSIALVTCNRIELYGTAQDPDDAFSKVSGLFSRFSDFARYAYSAYGRETVLRHATLLAAGLKSQVKGELEILGQIKDWVGTGGLSAPLKALWDEAILLSHDLRKAHNFYDERNNIASLIFRDIRKKLSHKNNYEIVIVGTGKIAGLFAQFKPKEARLNFAAHRNFKSAQALASRCGGNAEQLSDIAGFIAKADVIITAAKSPHYILNKSHFEMADHKLYIYDLSIPRAVEPAVRDLPGVVLYNIDDFTRLRVGTRPSPLAIKQAEEIILSLQAPAEIISINTSGDKDKITPIRETEGSDFFTKELEQALLNNEIDIAVHSAKDLEGQLPPQIITAGLTKSLSPYECLISVGNLKLSELPASSVIGTSSAKRQEAIKRFRPDLVTKDIRGNIEERIKQLDEGLYDAIIVAHAALLRLGYQDRIAEIISPEVIAPHPLQGRLAVQIKRDRHDLYYIKEVLNA